MKLLIIIPARGGSKGLPGKNLMPLGGLSLVARAVVAAREFLRAAGLSDVPVLVDTDSPAIAEEGVRWGAIAPFLRPAELAGDDTPTIANVTAALQRMAAREGPIEAVMLLQPTSPLRTADDIVRCWAEFDGTAHPSVVSVVQATHPVEYALRVAPDGTLHWAHGIAPRSMCRQHNEASVYPNGAVYISTVDLLNRHRSFIIPGVTRGVAMPANRSVDIDTAEDLRVARALLRDAHVPDAAPGPSIQIAHRAIGRQHPPLVIAEIGINHEGNVEKALRMVDDAHAAGAECVKMQSHVVDDEMVPNDVVPGNASETIWDIMARCALTEDEERWVKEYVESKGMIYLCTPFSRAAADRLERMQVAAYKIGSGECNNYPLVRHIAGFGRPIILSTGMNDLATIEPAVEILRSARVPFALLHCTSMYPTPYEKVRLGALSELAARFPDAVIGLSDHSLGNYTCFAAVALGASILEKHFTSVKTWPGPDVPISIDPPELEDLIVGSRAIQRALGGRKEILPEEQPTIDFAYASVVAVRHIAADEVLSTDNIWAKRPGTGAIKAAEYDRLLGRRARRAIPKDTQLSYADIV